MEGKRCEGVRPRGRLLAVGLEVGRGLDVGPGDPSGRPYGDAEGGSASRALARSPLPGGEGQGEGARCLSGLEGEHKRSRLGLEVARCVAVWCVLLACPAVAQVTDSSSTPSRPDSLEVARDTAAVLATPVDVRPALMPFGPAPGRRVTAVPAVTAVLDVQELLEGDGPARMSGRAPAAFVYALGAPGRIGGVSLDGLDPAAPALVLDGRSIEDVITGAPRYDLLPLGVVGPLRVSDGAFGRATAVHASSRSFAVGVPVTELRYLGGGLGTRHASGTHAQTRRAPKFFSRAESARITLTGHAANRASDGLFAGAQLRHTDAFARALLARPGLVLEAGVSYVDRLEGARTGVVAATGQPATALFDLPTVNIRQPSATRRTLRTEAWTRARIPIVSTPTELGVSFAAQRRIYAPGSRDTMRVHGRRVAAFLEQPLEAGPHALRLRLDAAYEPPLGPDTGVLLADDRLGIHAVVSDSLRVGALEVAAQAGAHTVGGEAWPSGAVRVRRGAFGGGVRVGGRARSRLDVVGLEGAVVPGGPGTERSVAADVGLEVAPGSWRVSVRAFGESTQYRHDLVAQGDSLVAVAISDGTTQQGGVGLEVGWREQTRRGLYVRIGGTARSVLGAASDFEQRLDDALPRAWGRARVGVRAEDVGDGVLDLDLAVVAEGWTSFRSRRVEPVTGALVLPDPASALGIEIPGRAILGLEATATFSARASLFLRYDNSLAGRVYNGALVTQGEPLSPPTLRFGVFWALLN